MRVRFYGQLWGLHGYQVLRKQHAVGVGFWSIPKTEDEITAVELVRQDETLRHQARWACGVNVL